MMGNIIIHRDEGDPLIYKLWCGIELSVNYKFQSKTTASSTTTTGTRTRPPAATTGDEVQDLSMVEDLLNVDLRDLVWKKRRKRGVGGILWSLVVLFFYIGLLWNELKQKDRRTCNFIQKKIHKLPFGVVQGTKAFQISNLQAIVAQMLRKC
jgi:hypothetical protein